MEKNSPKSRSSFEKVKKYSLKAIQLILIFILLDFLSTFVAIKVLAIAEEKNPIAVALWEELGFWQGSIYLTSVMIAPLIFMYFAILFAPTETKLGKAFLSFSGGILILRIIAGIVTLINNYGILTQFFLSKL